MKLFAPILADFYKTSHKFQFPPNTTFVYSNSTNRSAKHFKGLKGIDGIPDYDNKVVNFGIQGVCRWLLIDLWNETFFNRPKEEAVGKYARLVGKALGQKSPDVQHIADLHDLGFLPITIKALPEGERVNIKVPNYTIFNSIRDARYAWVTNFLETQLQSELWKVATTATIAYEYRRLFEHYADQTGVDRAFVQFQGHDFSMRGMSGVYDAAQCGAGHLMAFNGTDTMPAIEYLEEYYEGMETFLGGSVPATEHAVMCMYGKDGEIETFKHIITEVHPEGIVSVVSDTWDFWQVVTGFMKTLKPVVLARKGKVVLRPDSGDPVDIIVGTAKDFSEHDTLEKALSAVEDFNNNRDEDGIGLDIEIDEFRWKGRYFASEFGAHTALELNPYSENSDDERSDEENDELDALDEYGFIEIKPTPEMKGAVECLWDIYGGTETSKGFKTLHENVGFIYGDSINLDRAFRILDGLMAKGFSSANIVFGIGSFTYQFVTRDTFGTAVKATFGIVDGEEREIFKDPKTDDGLKKSARGLIRVEKEGDDYVLYDQQTWEQEAQGALRKIFENSQMLIIDDVDTIRGRLYTAKAA